MYHVFYVNKGVLLLLTPPALGSVYDLQKYILKLEHIEIEDQAIYLPCGAMVSPNAKLSSHCGTEENPLFLVRRIQSPSDIQCPQNDEMEGVQKIAQELNIKGERLRKVSNYSHLITEMNSIGKSLIKEHELLLCYCKKVYNEHRHLHNAWLAINTHADEYYNRIRQKLKRSMDRVERFLSIRQYGKELLSDFDESIRIMSMIVIPSSMLAPIGTSSRESINSIEDMTLYEWITSKDPKNRIENLPIDVSEIIEKTNESDLIEAQKIFDDVTEQIKSANIREISGMNKRLNDMDAKLKHLESSIFTINDIVNQIFYDEYIKYNYTTKIEELKKKMKLFHETSKTFYSSKLEVLSTILTRIYNSIQMNYFKLNNVNIKLTIFYDKYVSLKQRIDLVRQIKEAPIMYLTGVTEVIRRETLQKEFVNWLENFTEKSNHFTSEENKIRTEFYKKLENHFLRQIFYGMYEKMPNIVSELPKIDQNLPKVTVAHLRELRKIFSGNSTMQDFLKVSIPQVYSKLFIADPSLAQQQQQISQIQISGMRRDESFFVRDKTLQMDIINKNFPSTGWLSEENISISPSQNYLMMNNKKSSFSSINSLMNFDAQMIIPSELDFQHNNNNKYITPHSSTFVMPESSEPITIKNSMDSGGGSRPSSHFGTPDDNFEIFGRCNKNQASFRNYSPKRANSLITTRIPIPYQICENIEQIYQTFSDEFLQKCRVVQSSIKEFSTFFHEIKDSIMAMKNKFIEEQQNNFQFIQAKLIEETTKRIESVKALEIYNEKIFEKKCQQIRQNFENENSELKKIIEYEKYSRKEKEAELNEQKNLSNKLNEDLLAAIKGKDDLQAELLKVEEQRRRLNEQIEEDASIDYLSIELKSVEQFLKRNLTNNETQQIKNEIEKRKAIHLSKFDQPEIPAIQKASIKSEYEKAYKNKMEFIVKGIEDKKNKEISQLREQITAELRLENELNLKKIKERNNELEEIIRNYEAKNNFLDSGLASSLATNSTTIKTPIQMLDSCLQINEDTLMQESCMEFKNYESTITIPRTSSLIIREEQQNEEILPESSSKSLNDYENDFVISELKNHVAIQTRIRMRQMKMMISLEDVNEGSAVMIMWDSRHNSYIVFSTNTELYFVKESSLNRLGINLKEKTRRSWMFAIIISIETCQIKREQNRYNLPINTRFNRVSVDQLVPEGSSTSFCSSSSISASKR